MTLPMTSPGPTSPDTPRTVLPPVTYRVVADEHSPRMVNGAKFAKMGLMFLLLGVLVRLAAIGISFWVLQLVQRQSAEGLDEVSLKVLTTLGPLTMRSHEWTIVAGSLTFVGFVLTYKSLVRCLHRAAWHRRMLIPLCVAHLFFPYMGTLLGGLGLAYLLVKRREFAPPVRVTLASVA